MHFPKKKRENEMFRIFNKKVTELFGLEIFTYRVVKIIHEDKITMAK
mgnify:CR=1 FL=1